MTRATTAAAFLLGSLLPCFAAADVAIVVHPDNPESNLRAEELVRILRQEQRRWKAGSPVYLVFQASGSPAREIVLRRVFRLTDIELKQLWLAKLYRGEIAAFPHVAPSEAAVKRVVGLAPHALGFLDASAVDDTVKVLRVDGKLPGQAGYLLSGTR